MTIHLSKDLERFVRDAVQTGRYASEDDVIRDALARLKETLPKNTKTPAKKAKPVLQKNEDTHRGGIRSASAENRADEPTSGYRRRL
jgi:putative addiction module CopG family antidote